MKMHRILSQESETSNTLCMVMCDSTGFIEKAQTSYFRIHAKIYFYF